MGISILCALCTLESKAKKTRGKISIHIYERPKSLEKSSKEAPVQSYLSRALMKAEV
ncbi:hypothetical protein KIN20_012791 [Parelaphostrongylus tenuis]|uniref:Uncharacterized protein n=1 Tax=Parelaphostrongylus tenuis TaxID=148309 RepID=A0AAD5MFP0_PARTN|nr:hypothetical protein KIN20_012791 [Parelaphostrongylus tenuis]